MHLPMLMTFYFKVFPVIWRNSIHDLTVVLCTTQNSLDTFWSVFLFATSVFPMTDVCICICSQKLRK